LKSRGTENVSLYETAKPIETAYANQELTITDNANSFSAYMELGDANSVTYSATGELSYHSNASINGFSLKSSLAQWFLGDPMVLGINILVLLSLPFVAMPILEMWLFWREPSIAKRLRYRYKRS
jgi:hypothetical protein